MVVLGRIRSGSQFCRCGIIQLGLLHPRELHKCVRSERPYCGVSIPQLRFHVHYSIHQVLLARPAQTAICSISVWIYVLWIFNYSADRRSVHF